MIKIDTNKVFKPIYINIENNFIIFFDSINNKFYYDRLDTYSREKGIINYINE